MQAPTPPKREACAVNVTLSMRAALAAAALAGALTGCGSSSFLGSGSATATVRQFLEAAAARDGPAACGLLTGQGQQVMSAYPRRLGAAGAQGRSCQQTISRLGALPHSQDWDEMARGTICVYGTQGRDSQTITVEYRRKGANVTTLGAVQDVLGPGFRIVIPTTPAGAGAAGGRCSGCARRGRATRGR